MLLDEAKDLRVELQRLVLVVDHDARELDLREPSQCCRPYARVRSKDRILRNARWLLLEKLRRRRPSKRQAAGSQFLRELAGNAHERSGSAVR